MAPDDQPGAIVPAAAASPAPTVPADTASDDVRAVMRRRLAERRLLVRTRVRDRLRRPGARRLARALLGVAAVWLIALGFGLAVAPLQVTGVMLAVLAMIAVFVGLLLLPAPRPPDVATLRKADIGALGGRARAYIAAQRPALPAPAQPLLDRIGGELDALAPRIAALGEGDPLAVEARRLLGDHLPALIASYTRIPEDLRRKPNAGATPEQQLTGGLDVIAREIETMRATIARDDLDALATRGRYLETKYVDGDTAP